MIEKMRIIFNGGETFEYDQVFLDPTKFFESGGRDYFITFDGKVLSGKSTGGDRHEIAQYNGKGYRRVRLRGKTFKVHRLVAEAFLPNPDGLPYVLHLDGDKTNNHVVNLQWSNVQGNHVSR